MSLIAYIVWMFLLGGLAYFVSWTPWVAPWFKTPIYFVLGVCALGLTLEAFGLMDQLRSMQVPHV